MKNTSIFVEHIIDSIKKIEEFTANISENEFKNNVQLQDAVIRRLEIIGEAAKNLPKNFTERHPEVLWKDIIGTRDKVIHHYFGVDLDIVWNIIKKDLSKLKEQIQNILEDNKN